MRKIILSVINDLETDQRVHRIALTLQKCGFKVLLVGRKLPTSVGIHRSYDTHRMKLFFLKGPFFYIEYNIRLFVLLLFRSFNVLWSNDLDTLPANFFASKLKRKILIYDSHEIFTQVPELINRKTVQGIWKRLENWLIYKPDFLFTVNDSVADFYKKEYKVDFQALRNLPYKNVSALNVKQEIFKLPHSALHKKILLYQGALNIGRGIELMIDAMQFLDDYFLLIAGSGDIENELHEKAQDKKLSGRILFTGRIPFESLKQITQKADLGLSLEENMGLNYYFASPNKVFDYVQARVPVLVSDFPEMVSIVKTYNIGAILNSRDPLILANQIKGIFQDHPVYYTWKENLEKAAKELCWENEEQKLIRMMSKINK